MHQWFRRLLVTVAYFSNNLVSRIGIFLVTAATVLWIFAIPTMLLGKASNPYAGILLWVFLPTAFFLGLALIPLGFIGRRRAAQQAGWVLPETIDFTNSKVRSVLTFVAAATVVNLAIGSQFTYSAVNYMEGTSFCGTSCHIMRPEFTAFSASVHRNVECVRCHAGPGAAGFVQSKMAGVHQLVDTVLQRFDKPVHPRMPPLSGKDTCELCHSRETDHGDKLRTTSAFASDEANTRSETVMLMHVGGAKGGNGIHGAHLGVGVQIDFAADARDADVIQSVRVQNRGKKAVIYSLSKGLPTAKDAEYRAMDCVDCHNRVAHKALTPEQALDASLESGAIPRGIPFIRRQGVQILRDAHSEQAIEPALRAFYSPLKAKVSEQVLAGAIVRIRKIWRDNVFPELNTGWGTHADQLGHTAAPGCFRCHDGEHTAAGGRSITQDCESCHHVIALEEQKPKILDDLGIVARN